MGVTSIILVGPKKTGTTTFYEWLNKSYRGPLTLIPKEQNDLYSASTETLKTRYRKGVIEICPDYFADARAYLRLKNLYENEGIDFHIVILDRDPEKRLKSHVNYMLNEGVITPELKEPEVVTIALQMQQDLYRDLWAGTFKTTVLNLPDTIEMNEFAQREFAIPFDYNQRDNLTGGKATGLKTRVFRPIAGALRAAGAARLVEHIRRSGLLTRLAHHSAPQSSPQVSLDVLERIAALSTALHPSLKTSGKNPETNSSTGQN